MEFKRVAEVENGVLQREFALCVAGEVVPGVLWTPTHASPRALIAMGHGGSSHKQSATIRTRAIRYAQEFAWASLAIDAPQHGERISATERELAQAKTAARIKGAPTVPALTATEKIHFLDSLAAQAVPEWQAALDTVLASTVVTAAIPVAYWGVSQGSTIGIPLLAADNRFTCALLGLAHLHPDHTALRVAAQKITIPLRFAFQWDDTIRDRDYGLALFDAFGSKEKSMHIHPGGHLEIPAAEVAAWDQFFGDHLPHGKA